MKNIVAIIMLMICSVSLAHADAPIEIWAKSRTSGYADFASAMKDKTWTAEEGGFKIEGLCAVAYSAALGQKVIDKTLSPQLYCNAFMKRNGVGSNLVSEDMFRNYRWYLPDMQYVVSVTQPAKITAQAEARLAKNTAQQNKAKAPDQQLTELKQKVATIAQRPNNDEKTLRALKEAQKIISSLEGKVAMLQNRGLTSDMRRIISGLVEQQVTVVSVAVDSINKRLSGLEEAVSANIDATNMLQSRVEAIEKQNAAQAAKDADQDAKINASTPFGYSTIEYLFGTKAANEHAGKLLTSLIGILAGIVLLVYPFVFTTRSNLNKVKATVKENGEIAIKAMETADEAKITVAEAVHVSGSEVEFDTDNISIGAISLLAIDPNWIGYEQAKQWICWCGDEQFSVKIWREKNTPSGLIQTNIVRNSVSQQPSDAMSPKKLRSNIISAIEDPKGRRLQPVKVNKAKAA